MLVCWLAMCENVNEGCYNPKDAHVLQAPVLFCLHAAIGRHQSSSTVELILDLIAEVGLLTSLSLSPPFLNGQPEVRARERPSKTEYIKDNAQHKYASSAFRRQPKTKRVTRTKVLKTT